MASILRSGKFVRYFAGFFNRNLVFNSFRETDGNLIQNTQCVCSNFSHAFATAAPKPDQNLDQSIKKLDQDARRMGRISRRDIEEVLDEIRAKRSATSSQSLLVIRCCGDLVPEELPEIRTALVQEIWKTLNSLNVPMDVSHYNALLRVYLENEHEFSPTEFLTDLEEKGVVPNRVTYQRLITRYCQQGDIDGATRILEYMREKGLPVNENVFNALILGHSQANDMESAAGILPVMKQAGLAPSADTFTTLLCCYAKHGDVSAIMRILDECEKTEIYLLDKDLLDVIYALTISGNSDKIDQILSKIRKSIGYNHDAIHTILRLTNKGYEDVAFKILKTMPRGTKSDGELADTGYFFIRQLIKANRPIETILQMCKNLQDENLNSRALLSAVEASLTSGQTDSAILLLKEIKSAGMPIRQHYFWPLICSANALDVVKRMQEEFAMSPSGETIREYVIPNLKEKNFEKIITLLRNAGVSVANASTSTAFHALINNKIHVAAEIAANHTGYYAPGLFRKPLVQALAKTKNFDAYIKFIRQLYDSIPRLANVQGQTENNDDDIESNELQHFNQGEILGQFVYDATVYFKADAVECVEKILTGLVDQGLSISNNQAEKIQERLSSEMTATISELLGKLTAGNLEPVQIEKSDLAKKPGLQSASIVELERMIEKAEARNDKTNGLKHYLLLACFKSKNIEKTEEVINSLQNQKDFVLTSGIYAQLIDLYCHHGKLESAISTFNSIKSKEPDFVVDNFKTVKVVELFCKSKQLDEAIKFLETNKKDNISSDEKTFNYNTSCWRVLNLLAEEGNATDLERMFEAMVTNNYIEPNNVLLGPLVKVHLISNDLKKAVDTFEKICNKYQATPWKNDLACRLIQSEDAANLQRVTDLSTNIHGEVNSLYDLVFSFVECGRIRQARKILETPGLRSRPQRINLACERYRQEGMVQPLEGLVEATKDLNHIDRGDIYYNLLLSYCKEDQPEKALGLWTKMQEEDITPSDQFLAKLSEFLIHKKLEVPFAVPKIQQKVETSEKRKTKTDNISMTKPKVVASTEKTPSRLIREALKSGNIDEALKIKEMSRGKITGTDQTLIVEALTKADRLTEATKCIFEIIDSGHQPMARIFKFYLNKLALSGDISTMKKIGEKTTTEQKKFISFDNRYCNANIAAGKSEEYLSAFKKEFENAKTDTEREQISDKFPRGGAIGILEKHPELTGKFEEIAEMYAAKGFSGPINVLWIHHIINNNENESTKIFDKYLVNTPRLMFQRVLQTARERQDETLVKSLITKLKTAKISEGALGNAYSCLLDILSGKENYDEGLKVLQSAINDICLENFNQTALMRLKSGVEKNGKSFPYKIPLKSRKLVETSSSSSGTSTSSSEDEVLPPDSTRKIQ